MRKILTVVLLAMTTLITAQELNIQVNVKANNIENADPKIFKTLEAEITEMINSNTWTDDTFEDHERIEGQITLTISKEINATNFEAELAIVTARPVFNSTYKSQLIKYLDRSVIFSYDGIRPIQKSENNYLDNLSSIISYYVYIIIGMDYDSFSPNGGNPYFDKAFDVYTALPSGLKKGRGWTTEDNSQHNRYYLLNNIRNPSLKGFRNAFYEYHRLALDKMSEDPGKARASLLGAITQIGEVEKNYPRSILIRMFSDAKELEILDIFRPASKGEKSKVSKIMSSINPMKSTAYKNL